jgi:hemoglobin-like flavoprotein
VLKNQAQIDLIEASFEEVKLRKAEFAGAFYSRLFHDYPELQPLFSQTNINRQGTKLYAALVLLVENLRHPEELERVLLPLGEKHIGYGATPEAFPKVGGTIIATLKQFLGDTWTPALNQAWELTLRDVTATMLRGAGMTAEVSPVSAITQDGRGKLASGEDAVAKRVQDSFAMVKVDHEAFTSAFYQELFDRSPHLQPLFEHIDTRKQGAKLHAALVLCVENLRRPSELEKVLLPLGKKHVGYGATAESYPLVSGALLATLEKFLGEEWTGPVADAWAQTLDSVTSLMLSGAEESVDDKDKPATSRSAINRKVTATAETPLARERGHASRKRARRRSAAAGFADWFYSAPLSTLVGVWALIGTALVSLSFVFPEVRGIVIFANPLSLLLALFLYIRETPERKKQFHYHAWSTIDHAAHVKTSNARFLALQDLCADGVSLKGLSLEGVELKGINLAEAELGSATLSECNLSGGTLDQADMNNADLTKANLSGAQLSGANLGFARLNSANCSSADFSGTNLMFANLSNANLSGANLTGAKLSGAILDGTYLSGANLQGTDLGVADLENAFLVGAVLPDGSLGE